MTIIQIDPLETGQHPIQSQSGRRACWLEGYIEVPAHLHDAVWATYGWCDLQIEGDKLVGITPTERPPEPEPEPKPPSAEDITLDMLSEHEERLCMLEITTNAV
jgi:hypothetical protein